MNEDFNILNKSNAISHNAFTNNTRCMLSVVDWLVDVPYKNQSSLWVEVQFKNTHKYYYRNDRGLSIEKGDVVVVDGNPGYDVGEVVLLSPLVMLQMGKNRVNLNKIPKLSILRKATEADISNAKMAHEKEIPTLIRARQIAASMGLDMKIGNVEFQGDGKKAIFYYIAEHRIDFRQLIKFYIESFRIRVEMRQIGVRQEAGGIGGIGPCGRELCCSSWKKNFTTISASAAKKQNLSLNPQKLAGLCAKLKCCINYELPVYEDAIKHFPNQNVVLETSEGVYYFYAMEALSDKLIYSTDKSLPKNLITLSSAMANEIIQENKKGNKPQLDPKITSDNPINYTQMVHDDVSRFDKKKTRTKQNTKYKERNGEKSLTDFHK